MKIGFITDTNIITKKQGDNKTKLYDQEKFLDNIDFFTNYINDFNGTNPKDELVYLMPETIIEELVCQKVEAYNEKYEILKEKYEDMNYGLKGELPKNNIIQSVNKEKKIYEGKVKIIKLKYQNKIYRELVKEALNKLPPFDKSADKRKSDAGFKDALIWKTLLYSEEIDDYDVIYYFTGDSIFKDNNEYLVGQFSKNHINTKLNIKFIQPDDEKLQNCLKVIINENKLPETDCVKLYDKIYILNFIKKLEYNYINEVKLNNVVYDGKEIYLKDINFNKFDIKELKIEEVKKEENEFYVDVKFNTKRYELSLKEVVLTEKRNVIGTVKLKFIKNNRDFILKDNEITKVKFEESFPEMVKRLSNSISNFYIENSAKLAIESISRAIEPLKIAYENAFKSNFGTLLLNNFPKEDIDDNVENDEEDDISKGEDSSTEE